MSVYKDWNESYSVGVLAMDNQHKKLFAMINDLHAAIKAKDTREAMGKVLDGLLEYTREHFANEESLMGQCGYPDFKRHKQLHTELVAQVGEINERFRKGEPVISVELFGFLMNWLTNHIQGADKLYSACLNSKGVR